MENEMIEAGDQVIVDSPMYQGGRVQTIIGGLALVRYSDGCADYWPIEQLQLNRGMMTRFPIQERMAQYSRGGLK